MKIRQKYIWLAAAIVLIAVFLVVVNPWRSSNPTSLTDAVTAEHVNGIKAGMTEREVENILGRPADRQYHPWDISVFLAPAPGTSPEWEKMWIGHKGQVIIVHFDDEGKVCNKAFAEKLDV